MKRFLPLLAIFFVMHALADTPPPGTVKAKMFSGDGVTSITATSGAIDVNVKNTTGLTTVNQGAAGVSSWLASITSSALPTNACREDGGHLASIDSKLSSTLQVSGAFYQAVQPVSGTFWQATQPVSGTLTCNVGTGTQNVSVVSALPTGANTIGNVNINGTVPISGTITATNSANGNTGSAVPTQATQVAGSDGTNLRALKVSATGVLSVDGSASTQPVSGTFWQATQPVSGTFWQATQPVSAASLPLPTGAATSALQTTGNTSLGSIDTKTPALVSGRVPVDGSGVTQPVSGTFWQATQPVSGTFWQTTQPVSAASLPLPTGAATQTTLAALATSASSIDTKTPALGQALAAGSVPVVLTASQLSTLTPLSTVAVSNFPATQPVSGTVAVSNFPASQAVTGTFWQATQPVSAASLPLPSGAATAAKQPALGTAGTASADVITVQGIASMTALKVDGSAVTQPISASALPLPAGAATSALQTTGNSSLSSIDGKTATLVSGRVPVDGSAVTQPISASSLPLPTGAATSALQTTGNSSLSSIDTKTATLVSGRVPVDGSAVTQPVSLASAPLGGANASQTTGTVSTVITLTAPANAQGFILQNLDTSTANIRFAMGATATTTLGMQLQPGRDTGFVPTSVSVSLVSESGTQNYNIQWVSR